MGIFDALTTAVAGLQAQSFALQNISGNIANSQTTAYKETDTSFQDLVSEAAANAQVTNGVIATSVPSNTVQGTIQSTAVATDMAINGDGWFVVSKPTAFTDNEPVFSGVNDYTRAGDFQLNASGNLVNAAGYYLMGIPVDSTTGNPLGSVPQVLQFNNNFIPAVETTQIQYQANLPSSPSAGMLIPSGFEANPLAGASISAQINGTGAALLPDAPASGTGTVSGLSGTTTLASLGILSGDTITVNDGINPTYTYTATGSDNINSLIAGIGGSGLDVTASVSSGQLVLTGTNDIASIAVSGSGAGAAALGFGAGQNTFQPTNLLTQDAVAQGQSLTVTVGPLVGTPPTITGTPQSITFGTLPGQINTLAGLQTALGTLTGVTSTIDGSGNIALTATDPTQAIEIGGDASPTKFGITNLTALPANGTVIGNDVTTFTNESVDGGSITAYDSEGDPVNVQFRWAKVDSTSTGGSDSWQLFYQTNPSAVGFEPAWQNVGTTFTFNASGQMSPPITSLTLQNLTVNNDSLGNVQLQLGTNGLTQFANASGTAQVNNLQQNGYAAGALQSVAVDSQNRVVGTFSNGQTIPLAEITLATFNGTDSLEALNGGAYAATPESGPPIYSATGTIEGSSLESSNVDIATQFSQLIVAQQAYSANAKVMSTADQMIQSLLTVLQ
jgi:flagellar hook protein FlgE